MGKEVKIPKRVDDSGKMYQKIMDVCEEQSIVNFQKYLRSKLYIRYNQGMVSIRTYWNDEVVPHDVLKNYDQIVQLNNLVYCDNVLKMSYVGKQYHDLNQKKFTRNNKCTATVLQYLKTIYDINDSDIEGERVRWYTKIPISILKNKLYRYKKVFSVDGSLYNVQININVAVPFLMNVKRDTSNLYPIDSLRKPQILENIEKYAEEQCRQGTCV